MTLTSACLSIAVLACAAAPLDAATLTVSVTGAAGPHGQLIACLWRDGTGFPNCDKTVPLQRTTVAVSPGLTLVTFRDVAPGTYAVSVAHDLNGNDKVDTNFLGIPREPVGMSNGAVGRLGAPRFKDAAFSLQGNKSISIILARP